MPNTKYIAIVDDHAMFRKSMTMLINMFPDYKVQFDVGNGIEFMKQLNPEKLPDIVLMDVSMPEMDGYETTKWIKANHPSVKVLALSTMDAETSIIKMIKCGAKGYVLKDADPSELKLAFSEVLNSGFFYNETVTKKIFQYIHLLSDDDSSVNTVMKLNERELEFIKKACSEKSYQQIAQEMFVSERTVDSYRENLFKKLNVSTRVGLVMYAIKNEIVKL
jgi:DNA-binding NarL/FixJ family response regulator